jgi:phosphoribosyl 1,2-cyclic phosphate phosphodiesterase
MRVTILGCGASAGVPVIGCDCTTCTSDNPKNMRSRVSILVEYAHGTTVLIDASPDLRQQALYNNIRKIDAVIFTHDHADHTHGIDDLRAFNSLRNAEIDAYATIATLEELKRRFGYVWHKHKGEFWSRAALDEHHVKAGEMISLACGERIQTFSQQHGAGETLGLRFGNVVYSTDVNAFPPESLPHLHNVDVWIVDCLRDGFSGSHANLETALDWVNTFKPKRTILTHMNHELEYCALKSKLPHNVEPAWDGMIIDIS